MILVDRRGDEKVQKQQERENDDKRDDGDEDEQARLRQGSEPEMSP